MVSAWLVAWVWAVAVGVAWVAVSAVASGVASVLVSDLGSHLDLAKSLFFHTLHFQLKCHQLQ